MFKQSNQHPVVVPHQQRLSPPGRRARFNVVLKEVEFSFSADGQSFSPLGVAVLEQAPGDDLTKLKTQIGLQIVGDLRSAVSARTDACISRGIATGVSGW